MMWAFQTFLSRICILVPILTGPLTQQGPFPYTENPEDGITEITLLNPHTSMFQKAGQLHLPQSCITYLFHLGLANINDLKIFAN